MPAQTLKGWYVALISIQEIMFNAHDEQTTTNGVALLRSLLNKVKPENGKCYQAPSLCQKI